MAGASCSYKAGRNLCMSLRAAVAPYCAVHRLSLFTHHSSLRSLLWQYRDFLHAVYRASWASVVRLRDQMASWKPRFNGRDVVSLTKPLSKSHAGLRETAEHLDSACGDSLNKLCPPGEVKRYLSLTWTIDLQENIAGCTSMPFYLRRLNKVSHVLFA
ncbi:hypothetical protein RRG08_017415 [Elysia crispata]|uniref:Uncharacterized protein n=1 Tax=Elysia crispata TaxID=231223 RepID=A0AAE0ZPW3_9GAST|nr:hypothetical protein RRG08_017415 [Elysia crispata]